ncbi:MAG TPA: DUF1801 domain-containing protein [Planctomycetota bacterium]|jgi:hypothetical protein|nr:DUF1801 domain-containing protein [Planctomycetota bacterium]
MKTSSPEKQLAGFIAKFSPEMATLIRAARKKMRERVPQALELVYDNYNFFVIGYGPSERPSEEIFSLAAQAKGLALCFLQGAGLPDPKGLLRGSGNVVRNIRLETAETLDRAEVRALMKTALERAKAPITAKSAHKLIIRSVSAKQRPRGAVPAAKRRTPPRRERSSRRRSVRAR